jgi:cell division protein FtsQ
MFTAAFGGAESRIAQLPQVKSVDISRDWPNTVRVTVVERQPWGTWVAGSTPYVIDQEGVVMPEGFAAPEGSLVIQALASRPLAAGEHVDQDAIALTMSLIQEVPVRMGMNLAEVNWTGEKGLTLTTDAGYTVVVGGSENINYKLAVWQQIDFEMGRESMIGHVLDLRFGTRPSLR